MAIGIGFFQLDNLIRNRIPFFFLKDESDISSYFGAMEKMHLQNYSILLSEFSVAAAEAVMKEKGAQVHSPLVVFCKLGDKSKNLAEDLDRKGYANVYYVLDGLKAFANP